MKLFNITSNNQHEALDDVVSLYKIYQNFRKIIQMKHYFIFRKLHYSKIFW